MSASVFENTSSGGESSNEEEQGLKLNLDRQKNVKIRSSSYVVSFIKNFFMFIDFIENY